MNEPNEIKTLEISTAMYVFFFLVSSIDSGFFFSPPHSCCLLPSLSRVSVVLVCRGIFRRLVRERKNNDNQALK